MEENEVKQNPIIEPSITKVESALENNTEPPIDSNLQKENEGTDGAFESNLEDEIIDEQSDNIRDDFPQIEFDYSSLTKKELIDKFKQVFSEGKITLIRNEIENIKINFYKKHKQENDEQRKKFLNEGGKLEEFKPITDLLEDEFKQLYKDYRERKSELTKNIEEQKKSNLAAKYNIIENIKELINKPEQIKNTVEEFHKLQDKWKNTGIVPQNEMKALYENYHFNVEKFYEWLNLNKESRELDFKRNLELKVLLCEKAESLILEKEIKKAFSELQILHERWREIGPVTPDKKDEIWQRFHNATTQIHKNHQDFFLKRKEEHEGNLKAKTLLCEKAEEISSKVYKRFKDWEKATNDYIELQKVWKTIGMVPKAENNKIFKRFKDASDSFFASKKEFYKLIIEEENNNLQLKTDICIKAESIKDSNDWKKTTNELINLQKEWKKIGPVSRKDSDKVWTRFRAACNTFFENKEKHFNSIDGMLDDNLKKKEELIEKIKSFKYSDNSEEDLNYIKQIQKDWLEIGHIPENKKIETQDKFKLAINEAFNSLKIDDKKKENIKFKIKIDGILLKQNAKDILQNERDQLLKKLHQTEADIKTLENNIGFFSKSKNSENFLKEFNTKIESGKKESTALREQIKYLDNLLKK